MLHLLRSIFSPLNPFVSANIRRDDYVAPVEMIEPAPPVSFDLLERLTKLVDISHESAVARLQRNLPTASARRLKSSIGG